MKLNIQTLLVLTFIPLISFSQMLEKNGLQFSCAIYTEYYKKHGADGSEYPAIRTGAFNCRCVGGSFNYGGKEYTMNSFNGALASAFQEVNVESVRIRGVFYNTVLGDPNKIENCFKPHEEIGNSLRSLKKGEDIDGNVEVLSICAISGTNSVMQRIKELEASEINKKTEGEQSNSSLNNSTTAIKNNAALTVNQYSNTNTNSTQYQNQIAAQKLQQQQYNESVEKLVDQSVELATEVFSLIDNLVAQAKEKRKRELERYQKELNNERTRRETIINNSLRLAEDRAQLFMKYSIKDEQTTKIINPDSIFYFTFYYDEFYKDEQKMKVYLSGLLSNSNTIDNKEKVRNIPNPNLVNGKNVHFNGIYYSKEDARLVYETFKNELAEYSIVSEIYTTNREEGTLVNITNSKITANEKATVYVIRKAGPMGNGQTGNRYDFDVYFNDINLATLSNKSYSELKINTGIYKVVSKANTNLITSFPYKIKVEKNKKYYIEIEGVISPAGVEIQIMEVPEENALKNINKLKQVNPK